MIDDVIDVIEGDGTPENRGYRAAGTTVAVTKPTRIGKDITVMIYVDANTDQTTLEAELDEAILTYISGLAMGDDLTIAKLSRVILNVSDEVLDVSIIEPSDNVTADTGEAIRADTLTVNFTVV